MDVELRGHLEDLLEVIECKGATCAALNCFLDQREGCPLIFGLQEVELGLKAAELGVEPKIVGWQRQVCADLVIHDLLGRAGSGCVGSAVLQREGVGRVYSLERAS